MRTAQKIDFSPLYTWYIPIPVSDLDRRIFPIVSFFFSVSSPDIYTENRKRPARRYIYKVTKNCLMEYREPCAQVEKSLNDIEGQKKKKRRGKSRRKKVETSPVA